MLYEGIRFSGPSYNSDPEHGVVTLIHSAAGGAHTITFRNCVIGVNSVGGNGVHLLDCGVLGESMHDIVFDHCLFESQARMAFECNERRGDFGHASGDYPGAYNIRLVGCAIAICGAEPISFDNNDPSHVFGGEDYGGGLHEVSGCRVAGCSGAWGQWPYTVEFNRVPHVRCTGNFFGPAPNSIVNVRCTAGDSHASDMDWVFEGNTLDLTAVVPGVTYPVISGGGKAWMCGNVQGGVKVSDRIIGPAPFNRSSWGYFTGVAGLDFSGSMLVGYTSNNPGSSGVVPPALAA